MGLRRSTAVAGLAFVAALVGLVLYAFDQYGAFYHDDAFISLRYARNWLAGEGLVWNPGERVEGYSNFLWTMAIAALGRLGIDLVAASRQLGLAAWLALIGMFGGALALDNRRRQLPYLQSLWPLVLVGGSFPLIIWSRGGLEGVAFTFWVTAGVLATLDAPQKRRSGSVAAICFVLAALTRPEGVLFWATAVLWHAHRTRRQPQVRHALIMLVALFLLLYLPYFFWRWHYYGAILPNTFYVKTGLSPFTLLLGIYYVLAFLFGAPFWGVWLGVTAVRGQRSPKADYLLGTIAVYLVYISSIGGDHMPAYRLLLPIIPLSARLLFEESLAWTWSPRRLLLINGLALATVGSQVLFPAEALVRAHTVDSAAFAGAIVGRHIAASWPAGSVIALHTAGSTPYFAPDHRFIDMLGLNDAHIARRQIPPPTLSWQRIPGHAKGDGAYVLSRAPDFIILGPAEGAPAGEPLFLSDLELAALPAFHERYQRRSVHIDTTSYRGWRLYDVTSSGHLLLTYYERRE